MITEAQRGLISGLLHSPKSPPTTTVEQVLSSFGVADPDKLGYDLLKGAADHRDRLELDSALLFCLKAGVSDSWTSILCDLAMADWHEQHEDVASALSELRAPSAIPALRQLAFWVPGYLRWDKARALAVKAIWGLAGIPTSAANECLRDLAASRQDIVANEAQQRLLARGDEGQ